MSRGCINPVAGNSRGEQHDARPEHVAAAPARMHFEGRKVGAFEVSIVRKSRIA